MKTHDVPGTRTPGALFLTGALLVPIPLWPGAGPVRDPAPAPPASGALEARAAAALDAYGRLPLVFEENRGQADPRVRFLSRGRDSTLFLTPTEAVLALPSGGDLRLRWPGARPAAGMNGLEEQAGKANYFVGADFRTWLRSVPTYARVGYRDAYPGIDLEFHGSRGRMEFDFLVAPGADPGAIRLELDGAERVAVDPDGSLRVALPGTAQGVRIERPQVYQEAGGIRRPIEGGYALVGERRVAFALAAYDRRLPLVIDPVLAYSTYLGGSSTESGQGIAVDALGNAYLTGFTDSSDFPTAGGVQPASGGFRDIFVAKLNPEGTALVYSTYIGGGGWADSGNGIAVDSAGSAHVTGVTNSTNFPITGSVQSAFGGGSADAFVIKLDPTGSVLAYSTYLGGSSTEFGQGIAVDATGAAYVTGWTLSDDFPTAQPLQPSHGGGSSPDAFVAKMDPSGSALLYSTFLGGGGDDRGNGIAVDTTGSAYLAGVTASTDFPAAASVQPAPGGGYDAFVARLNATGSGLVYSTYLGGGGLDQATAIAVDAGEDAVVTGSTASTDFPVVNALQPALNGASVFLSDDGGTTWAADDLANLGVRVLAVDSKTPSTLYAGTGGNGVFKSTDGARTWTAVNSGLTDLVINDLAFDPLSSSTLYAGTAASGVFRSTDGGATWVAIGPPVPGPIVASVEINPLAPTILYAAVRAWVVRSLDGGATWTIGGPGGDVVNDVEIDPREPTVIYAAVMRATPSGGGLYKSLDGGTTWILLTNSVASTPGGRRYDVGQVAIDPFNTLNLYITTGGGGIFKSTDGGATWTGITALAAHVLAIDPVHTATIYAAVPGRGVFKSTDGGANWSEINNGLGNFQVSALAIDPGNPARIYAGTAPSGPDAFVARLDPTGTSLLFSTYLGGGSADEGLGIGLDSEGGIHVVGYTNSIDFPTASPLQPPSAGLPRRSDAFVARLSPDGSGLTGSTHLGGSDSDVARGVAVDGAGSAYVIGQTVSSDFPTLGPLQAGLGGGFSADVFVTKLAPPFGPPAGVTLAAPATGNALPALGPAPGGGIVWGREEPSERP